MIANSVNDNDVLVAQIGFPAKELYNIRDRDLNFYMLGALGSATEVAIGLADGLASEQPERHVYVIDGDGSLIFNPNQLFDLAAFGPSNLSVICLDNGSWGSTGSQPTLSANGLNLAALASACGVQRIATPTDPDDLVQSMSQKPAFIHYLIRSGNNRSGVEVPYPAVEIKQRLISGMSG